MKRQIRVGVFETNSSSTHSLTMCSEEEFEKWVAGEIFFDKYADKFVESKDPDKSSWAYPKYDDYGDELEYFEERFTAKSGEVIVAFGEFGYGG